jgi:hypothetical protein
MALACRESENITGGGTTGTQRLWLESLDWPQFCVCAGFSLSIEACVSYGVLSPACSNMSYKNRTHSQHAGECLADAVSALIGGVIVSLVFGAASAFATADGPVTDTKRLASSAQEISCPVRLEGRVLWINSSGTSRPNTGNESQRPS